MKTIFKIFKKIFKILTGGTSTEFKQENTTTKTNQKIVDSHRVLLCKEYDSHDSTVNIYRSEEKHTTGIVAVIVIFALLSSLLLLYFIICKPNDDIDKTKNSIATSGKIEVSSSLDSINEQLSTDSVELEGFAAKKKDYQIVEDNIIDVFSNPVPNEDPVGKVGKILSDYYAIAFQNDTVSKEDIETKNGLIFTDEGISALFYSAQSCQSELDQINRNLFNNNDYLEDEDIGKYNSALHNYKEILSSNEIPYVVNRVALLNTEYYSMLTNNITQANNLGISVDQIYSGLTESIYWYIYDIMFKEYEFNSYEYYHDVHNNYYRIGLLYCHLAKLSTTDTDKAKNYCYAIYYFDNSYVVDNNEYTPTYYIALCYYNLAISDYTQKFRQEYMDKTISYLEDFINNSTGTTFKPEATDMYNQITQYQ